jgi:hypothetical protein
MLRKERVMEDVQYLWEDKQEAGERDGMVVYTNKQAFNTYRPGTS